MTSPSALAPADDRRAVSTFGLSLPLLLAALAFLMAFNNALLIDPDTYWHIATARWMMEHLAVPAADPFSHTMPGAPWVAHEWLAALILGAAHELLGWAGPAAVAAAAYALAMALVCRYLLRHLEPIYALGLATLSAFMVQEHLLARPHALILPLMAFWCISLLRARESGRAPAWPLALLMALWANLHGSFPLGLGLAMFFGLEAVLAAAPSERLSTAVAWGRFILLSVAAVLLTPQGLKNLTFAAHLNSMSYTLDAIGEWRSPDFHRFQALEVGIMVASLAILLRGLRLSLLRVLLVLGLLHMALVHARHVEILGLLVPLAVAESIGRQWRSQPGVGQAASLDQWFSALALPARPWALASVLLLLAAFTSLLALSNVMQPPSHNTPEAAVKAARAAVPQGRVLNDYQFGGYLIYSGIPTFIDGRADMYGDTFLADYRRALKLEAPDRLLALIQHHNITWTLLAPDLPAIALLDRLPGWRRLYADDTAVVHVRSQAD